MRSRSVCLGALLVILAAVGGIASAGEETGGPSGSPAENRSAIYQLPDGGLFLELPAGWERNPRLAEDNATVGFLHPAGMEVGETIPLWILVERRLCDPDQSFDALVRRCLEEGKNHGFAAQDSATIKTADGHSLINYRFNPGDDGAERALAFVETPNGAVLLRQHADDAKTWNEHEDSIEAIFASVRFRAKQEK